MRSFGTGINLSTNLLMTWKNQATCPRRDLRSQCTFNCAENLCKYLYEGHVQNDHLKQKDFHKAVLKQMAASFTLKLG